MTAVKGSAQINARDMECAHQKEFASVLTTGRVLTARSAIARWGAPEKESVSKDIVFVNRDIQGPVAK